MLYSDALPEIDHKISSLTSRASALQTPADRLPATLPEMNHFFQGGLRWGELSEWGSPWGGGCREVLLLFLAAAHRQTSTQPYWCLWVHDHTDVSVYPPAWQARGINLKYIRFAVTKKPLQDLKAAFTSSFFKLIILDCTTAIHHDDCCFLAQQARRHRNITIVIRNYFLSPHKGNVWAKTRVNCWHDPLQGNFYLKSVKGLAPKQLSFRI
ncbi:MAG: hypothetical protein ACOH5I_15505 [Oligoflexus sp.]